MADQIIASPTAENIQDQSGVMDEGSAPATNNVGAQRAALEGAASAAQPAPAAAPAAQPQPGTPAGEAAHHGVLGEIFQTLAGGKKAVWQQTENGPVKTYEDLKPGEMARGILAAAITGLASGYDPANRGKGAPPMSTAFAGGFKGEEAAREKQAKGAADEAQKEFQNKNISDEMSLRKHADARAQQESIVRMGHEQAETNKLVQDTAQGKEAFTDERHDRVIKQIADFENIKAAGWVPITDPTTNQPFGFADAKEAEAAAGDHASHLIRPGDFNTKIVYDPNKAVWIPMQQPKGYDDIKHIRFAKMKNGEPVMKDGQYVPDGTKGADGKPMIPAEMTNREFEGVNNNISLANERKATTAEKWAQASELLARQKKEKDLNEADNRMAMANNDPYAMNVKDGTFVMNDHDRMLVRNRAASNVQIFGKLANDLSKELGVAETEEDKTRIRAQWTQANDLMTMYNQQLTGVSGKISKEGALANSFIREYSDEKGFDAKKAIGKFDEDAKAGKFKVTFSPEELARTRTNLQTAADKQAATKSGTPAAAAGATNTTPDVMSKQGLELQDVDRRAFNIGGAMGTDLYKISGTNDDQTRKIFNDLDGLKNPQARVDYISKLGLSDETKSRLMKASAVAGAVQKESTVRMLGPDGKVYPVPESQVDTYLKNGGTLVQ